MRSGAVGILATTAIVLATVAIVEGFVITWLIATGTHLVVRKNISPIQAESPISLAVKYDAPDKTFEKVVKENLAWLPYQPIDQVLAILPECAYERHTNYVRILIKNGADVEEAEKQLNHKEGSLGSRLKGQQSSFIHFIMLFSRTWAA
jgi:hypothetical protein